jgi:hypothetical protein
MINVNPPAAKTVARTDPGHPFRDHPFRCRRNLVLTEPVVPRSGRLMIHTLRTITTSTAVPGTSPSLLTMSQPSSRRLAVPWSAYW